MSEPRTISELLKVGERVLSDSSHIFEDHDNADEARGLLAHALGTTPKKLGRNGTQVLTPTQRRRYLALVARRAAGEPYPILVEHIEFYGLTLGVWPGAFVPRPSSELLVDRAARRLRRMDDPVVVDLCTGAGPIALAIADEFPQADVWGCDIAPLGLQHGRRNAERLGLDNLKFRVSDMYAALPKRLRGSIGLITAHVPYVPFDEVADLPSEVKEHEPIYTLTDDSLDGLHLMRATVAQAPEWLRPGGWLLLEMSEDLATKVSRLCEKAGFETPSVASDNDDLSVVIEARLPSARRRD